MKLNRIDMSFPRASSIIKRFEYFDKMRSFYKSFCPFFSQSLHIYFNPFKKCFSYLTAQWFGDSYKWRVDCLQRFQKGKCKGVFALILRISFIYEIFQISLAVKFIKIQTFVISKFKLDRVHGKILSDTYLKLIYINTKQQS